MLPTHFILHLYLQKGPPKTLPRSATSFPLVEIQDFFFVCQTFQGFVSEKVPVKCWNIQKCSSYSSASVALENYLPVHALIPVVITATHNEFSKAFGKYLVVLVCANIFQSQARLMLSNVTYKRF